MILLIVIISITITLLLDGRPWYYYASACVLMALIGLLYGFVEIWFEHRQVKINPGHFNEVADRSACLANMIIRELLELPAVQQDQELKKHAEAAASKLLFVSNSAAVMGKKAIVIHDRAYMFFSAFHEMLVENHIIAEDAEALELANGAVDKLWNLYQHLSNKYI